MTGEMNKSPGDEFKAGITVDKLGAAGIFYLSSESADSDSFGHGVGKLLICFNFSSCPRASLKAWTLGPHESDLNCS